MVVRWGRYKALYRLCANASSQRYQVKERLALVFLSFQILLFLKRREIKRKVLLFFSTVLLADGKHHGCAVVWLGAQLLPVFGAAALNAGVFQG